MSTTANRRAYGAIVRPLRCVVAVAVLLVAGAAPASTPRVVKNPYGSMDWDRVTAYVANLHAHTVYSDGRAEPEALIRMYAAAGYDILAITDHDNYHITRSSERATAPTTRTTWPWTRWLDAQPESIWEQDGVESAAFYPSLGRRGMVAIRGNELTAHPHIVSLFNGCGFAERVRLPDPDHDRRRFACVEAQGGLAFWAHPAMYVPGGRWADRGLSWDQAIAHFGEFIAAFDSVLGLEMQLGRERRLEEQLFDRLLAAYYRDHDLFIMGSDDTHATEVAADATLTIVLAEELTGPSVRHALENGHMFVGSRVDVLPVFQRIDVDAEAMTITLDILHHDSITWIKNGVVHGHGESIGYAAMRDAIVRFEVTADGAVFYSQAFHIAVD